MTGAPDAPAWPETSARDAALAALGWTDGPLAIDGVACADLAAHHGTPLYVHSATALRERLAEVRAAFGDGVGCLLALKANPLASLARIAHSAGAGAEVASAGEILVARAAGVPGSAIQFAGPGKSTADLQLAVDVGARVHLESEREYERVAAIARERGARPTVAIRVNPGADQAGARLRMASASSRFGIDAERVAAIAARIVADDVTTLTGLHVYGGSQSFDADAWVETATRLVHLAREVARATGAPLRSLNFGGGFGWPVFAGDPVFDLGTAAAGLREVLGADAASAGREHWIELGRWLLAGGGVFLTRVVDVKDSGGRRHAVLDGGMHQFGAAAGLGAVMRRRYAMVRADAPLAADTDRVSLGGPLCTPADRFATDVPLPALEVGDLVAILNAGAYGLTFSPIRFLGHPTPAEVVVDRGAVHVARRAGSPHDALAGQDPGGSGA